MSPGIHLVHKPVGPTSFAALQAFLAGGASQGLRQRKPLRSCHGGALDPFASGLLLVLIEPATRLFDYLHAVPKVYEATIRWGIETDNGDPLGNVVATGDPSALTPASLEAAMARFTGWRDQIPPATSNKRIDGERAYAKAHRGEMVVLPPSKVYLHEARWVSHALPESSELRIVVRGGYYVRSLARDLGRTLGCGAHLSALHRTAIGPWLDPVPGQTIPVIRRALLPWAPVRLLSDQEVGDLRQDRSIPTGTVLPPDWFPPAGFPDPAAPIRGFHLGAFRFLLQPDGGQLRTVSTLPGLL